MARSDERTAVPVIWCPECKTGNAPYDDLGCCFKCLCPVERRVVTDADMRVLEAWRSVSADTLYMWANHPSEHVRDACRAELARRESTK